MKHNNILLALPCAGGSAANYHKWQNYLKCKLMPIEYSGHWSRYEEPLDANIMQLVNDVIKQILSNIGMNNNVYIFGHSMGGLVGWMLCDILQNKYQFNVKGLFISSAWAPSEVNDSIFLGTDDNSIKQFLSEIRQVPDKILESDFFHDNLLPMIRNDFRILSDFKWKNEVSKVKAPIICFGGTKDPLVKNEDLKKWRSFSEAGDEKEFMTIMFPGDHFYLYEKDNYKKMCIYINRLCISQKICC